MKAVTFFVFFSFLFAKKELLTFIFREEREILLKVTVMKRKKDGAIS